MNVLIGLQDAPGQLPELDLPGLVAPFLRAFFGAPQGVQMAGGIIAAVVGVTLLIVGVRKREALAGWFKSRQKATRIGLATIGVVLVAAVATGGSISWNYMQHDNEFCTGCHVMGGAFDRFTESGHAELNCHDCHQQSIFASTRQLHLWIKDRPQEIGEHAPVANEICTNCHINDDPDSDWFQIAATSGHVAHMESDSTALADLQCVTCHGQEVHEFLPADQTCGQSECHSSDDTNIVLGGMTEAEGIHCVTCHEFTAERVTPAPVDSATGLLTPGLAQCTSCHEMDVLWADYDPVLDPHDARCGACHNPHEQENPEVALKSCAASGCHARPDTLSTFHIGVSDNIEEDCMSCHEPHVWSRDGDDCAACHDLAGDLSVAVAGRGAVAGFTHVDHPNVECIACHSNRTEHGEATVTTQSECFSCHHATETAGSYGCGDCHGPDELGQPTLVTETLRMSVGEPERVRGLGFNHNGHTELRCVDCHGGDDRQAVQTTCATCHEDHHMETALVQCADCHDEHREDAHTADVHIDGCTGSGCHSEARYERMDKTRQFCAVCHQDQIEHEPAELCVDCHLVPVNGTIVNTIEQ